MIFYTLKCEGIPGRFESKTDDNNTARYEFIPSGERVHEPRTVQVRPELMHMRDAEGRAVVPNCALCETQMVMLHDMAAIECDFDKCKMQVGDFTGFVRYGRSLQMGKKDGLHWTAGLFPRTDSPDLLFHFFGKDCLRGWIETHIDSDFESAEKQAGLERNQVLRVKF